MHDLLRGLAAGDRNGGPIRLALRLYQLCVEEGFSQEKIFLRYLDWFLDGAYDTGPTLWAVCMYYQQGYSMEEAVLLRYKHVPSDGIAPAHRSTPLALFLKGTDLDNALYQEARCTHGSEISAQISIATGRICSYLLQDASLDDAIVQAHDGLDEKLSFYPTEIEGCSRGGYAPDVLQAALHFLVEYDSFEEALHASLSFAGVANYCPVLVGSIGACLHGTIANEELQHPECPTVFQM